MKIKFENFPQKIHSAAIVFKTQSVYHEGDERSRTNPGHGYPAHTEIIETIEYIPFNSKQEMDQWIINVETTKYNKPKYKLIEAKPLSAIVSATVSIV